MGADQSSFGDLRRLQRTVLPNGLVTREQAEVLIALDQTITRTDKAWAGYLVTTITDFVEAAPKNGPTQKLGAVL